MTQADTAIEKVSTALPLISDPEVVIAESVRAAKALRDVVARADLLVSIAGKDGKSREHAKFEAWQTLGSFYGVTAAVEWSRPLHDTQGALIGFEAKAVALYKGTMVSAAEAECRYSETNWSGKPEFQLRSMAQTRAAAKALRNVLARVMVLAGIEATPAEEVESQKRRASARAAAQQPAARPPGQSDPRKVAIGHLGRAVLASGISVEALRAKSVAMFGKEHSNELTVEQIEELAEELEAAPTAAP